MDISIVIPTCNRRKNLMQCLDSLFSQDYPSSKFEIIVIDDGSNDGTEEMLRRILPLHVNLRYIVQPHKGPAAARNLGIKEARAEIVAFTDNDCIAKEDWVSKMVEAHSIQDGVMAVGGSTKVNRRNIKALVSQFLSDGAIKINLSGNPEVIFFPTCNVSIKKRHLGEDGFKEAFPLPAGEDTELFWRFFKKGRRFYYSQDIEILHNCHPTAKSFLKQAYMYGRGNYFVQYIHKDHPLFFEIKTSNHAVFFIGTIINFLKIPRFSYLLGKRMINSIGGLRASQKARVYLLFALHKIMYLSGNIAEHFKPKQMIDTGKARKDLARVFQRPEFIILDITHRCNLECNICEIRKDKPIDELNTEEIKNLISQAKDWGVGEFVLSGGEPLLREDIFEILDFAKIREYRLGILSNGILLGQGLLERMLPHLTAGTLSLSVSIDALSPHIHDDIRGQGGSFLKTMASLKQLSGLKKLHQNINFNTITIILNENLEELLLLAEFLKSLGLSSIQFQPLLANNLIMNERSKKVKYWIPQERLGALDKTIDDLLDFKRRNSSLVRNSETNLILVKEYFRGTLTGKDITCLYADRTMLIANNGSATTCFDCYGNVRKQSIKEIYLSKESARARLKVRKCLHPCLLPCFTDN